MFNSFDVCEPYVGFVKFLQYVVLVGVFFYFITSSDSGSYVDDLISANGHANPPPIQKTYWCWTEGLRPRLRSSTRRAVRALFLPFGRFPLYLASLYTFAICFLRTSIYRCVKMESGELDIVNAAEWSTSVFDFTSLFDEETHLNKIARVKSLLLGVAMPFVGLNSALMNLYGKRVYTFVGSVCLSALWYVWFLLILTGYSGNAGDGQKASEYFQWLNVANLGWVFYVYYATMGTCVRTEVRIKKNIYGSTLEDFFTTLCMMPHMVISQLAYESGSAPEGIPI